MATVLVVDDSEMQRNNIRDLIEKAGHAVLLATNGQEGVEVYQKGNVDLILSDHNMPVLTGLEMCRKISTISEGKPPPIIMITTEIGDDSIKAAAKESGVKAWLVKPFKDEAISLILKRLLP
ncbi:MAG: response regulator [Pseudobacteriovorax sp.]|nr:response regulator [Pseudobacteriovorax sp.]